MCTYVQSLVNNGSARGAPQVHKAEAESGFGAFSSAAAPPRTPHKPAAARASQLEVRRALLVPRAATRSGGTSRWSSRAT